MSIRTYQEGEKRPVIIPVETQIKATDPVERYIDGLRRLRVSDEDLARYEIYAKDPQAREQRAQLEGTIETDAQRLTSEDAYALANAVTQVGSRSSTPEPLLLKAAREIGRKGAQLVSQAHQGIELSVAALESATVVDLRKTTASIGEPVTNGATLGKTVFQRRHS